MIIHQNQTFEQSFLIPKGITAIVGGGGKTTLLYTLAEYLSKTSRVIVTTSTHIFRPGHITVLMDPTMEQLVHGLEDERLVCIGHPARNNKLTNTRLSFCQLAKTADYVLVEADGAKGMPLKAPAVHEPVIPKQASCVIAVAGMDGVGKEIAQTVHRPQEYAAILGRGMQHVVTASDVANVLCSADGQRKHVPPDAKYIVLLNKAEDAVSLNAANEVAAYLDPDKVQDVVIYSLKKETCYACID